MKKVVLSLLCISSIPAMAMLEFPVLTLPANQAAEAPHLTQQWITYIQFIKTRINTVEDNILRNQNLIQSLIELETILSSLNSGYIQLTGADFLHVKRQVMKFYSDSASLLNRVTNLLVKQTVDLQNDINEGLDENNNTDTLNRLIALNNRLVQVHRLYSVNNSSINDVLLGAIENNLSAIRDSID